MMSFPTLDPAVHLGDLLVSGVGVALTWGMRMLLKTASSFLERFAKHEYVLDTHTTVLAKISGWRPPSDVYFDPTRRDTTVFRPPLKLD